MVSVRHRPLSRWGHEGVWSSNGIWGRGAGQCAAEGDVVRSVDAVRNPTLSLSPCPPPPGDRDPAIRKLSLQPGQHLKSARPPPSICNLTLLPRLGTDARTVEPTNEGIAGSLIGTGARHADSVGDARSAALCTLVLLKTLSEWLPRGPLSWNF